MEFLICVLCNSVRGSLRDSTSRHACGTGRPGADCTLAAVAKASGRAVNMVIQGNRAEKSHANKHVHAVRSASGYTPSFATSAGSARDHQTEQASNAIRASQGQRLVLPQ